MSFEENYAVQQNIAAEIQKQASNYGKDGDHRKTVEYLEKHKAELDKWWNKFNENDAKIEENYASTHKSHQYWLERQKLKAAVAEYNLKLHDKLEERASTSYHQQIANVTVPQMENPTNKIRTLQKIRGKMAMFQKHLQQIKCDIIQTKSKAFYNQKIKLLQGYWVDIVSWHDDLLAMDEQNLEVSQYLNNQEFEIIESYYQEVIIEIDEQLDAMASTTKIQCKTTPEIEVKLPRVEIPHFYGDRNKWVVFRDIFEQLVHENTSISQVHKMNYLKSSLGGEAAKLINHIQCTGDNYAKSWNIITDRYNNKRLLVGSQLAILLEQPTIASESAQSLRNLHDTIKECMCALENLGIKIDTWDSIIVHLMLKKLDAESIKLYETSLKDPKEIQSLDEFLTFLEHRFSALQAVADQKRVKVNYHTNNNNQTRIKGFVSTNILCKQCGGSHYITTCMKFKKMAIMERIQLVNLLQLCRVCLSANHQTRACTTSMRCEKCNGGHHELLHNQGISKQEQAKVATTQQLTVNNSSINEVNDNRPKQSFTILSTALAKVICGVSQPEFVRILIDPGSQATFITIDAAKRLNLQYRKTHVELSGIGDKKAGVINRYVTCKIEPRFGSDFSLQIKALVMNNLTKLLPDQPIDAWQWNHINNLIWADPNYNKPGKIDILLGADYYPAIILNELAKGQSGEPIAQRTELGWIIFGSTNNENKNIHSLITMTEIDENIKKFWELEELHEERHMTQEEQYCENQFENNYYRESTGRFVVALPFKPLTTPLGQSKNQALARFLQLEKKFCKSEKLAKEYKACMREYHELGHMKPCEKVQSNVEEYYIPHHAVIKENSTTTKLRVVFDASAKTSNGVSLNDNLLVGPTLQENLMSIIMRFRKYKFAFTADIEKMYRQIKIREEDQRYQKIVWRDSPSESIKEYQLTTVTFGTASAPYLAIKTLRQLASVNREQYPQASEIILRDFYVDDLISGGEELEEVLKMQKDLVEILKGAGFNLRKWASNHPCILNNIPDNIQSNEKLRIHPSNAVKTLGIYWNPISDNFEFKISIIDDNSATTKRQLLSEASKLFDPIGWLSPVIIQAKILMQELWLAGVTWDQELPTHIEGRWKKYKTTLITLEKIRIPRWLKSSSSTAGQIHGFCDASLKAYAAVVYYTNIDSNGKILATALIAAKTKVAPIKTMVSLPRLELCGAVLLSKLLKTIQTNMGLNETPIYAWTDSMITLSWIKGSPNKFKTFVANRVSQIQSLTHPSQWNYVKSSENPADCASRGLNPEQLEAHSLWWHGPIWLNNPTTQWPEQNYNLINPPEQKQIKIKVLTSITDSSIVTHLLQRFSKIGKIQRTIAYMNRFANNARKLSVPSSTIITVEELKSALLYIVKNVQATEYIEEISCLKRGKSLSNKSKLLSLNPFLDKNETLRVGGRLQNASCSFEEKHPAILPAAHRLMGIIIREAHLKTLHGGTQLTLAYIRKKFWIANGRSHIRQVIKSCIRCHRFSDKIRHQLMGNLPDVRVTPSRPFSKTGVDYAGPFQIRTTKGRGYKSYKGYLAIFVCMVTKAVHIEVSSDLTTETFLSAYKRFTARRGLCSDMYSDNGTNFIGANNELQKERMKALQAANMIIKENLAKDGTTWHVIPPAASNFGGLWERVVRSAKYHLKRIVGDQTLTFEELTTVVAQIEACLNSRPIMPMTNDPTDLSALTPGHFLIGDALIAPPQSMLDNNKMSSLTRWKLVEKLKQEFWTRWSQDYLLQLQQRVKWREVGHNMQPGQLVLVRDERIPPTKWIMARVIEVHPGKDNLVRVATIRGPGGTQFKRPVSKLSPLPINAEQSMTQEITTNVTSLTNPIVSNQLNKGVPSENSSTNTNQMKPVKSPPGNSSNAMLFLLNILLIFLIQPQVNALPTQVEIMPFKSQPGLYFEGIGTANIITSHWNFVIRMDLNPYRQGSQQIHLLFKQLNKDCQGVSTIRFDPIHCDTIITQLRRSIQRLDQQDELLQPQNYRQTRTRRGLINGVGVIANQLFGILDDETAQKYEEQFTKVQMNENHMLDLIKNQTSIAESTIKAIKTSEFNTQQQLRFFDNQLENLINNSNKADKETIEIEKRLYITQLAMYISMMIQDYKEYQELIIDILMHAFKGQINHLLITPTRFASELKRINMALPAATTIPGPDILNIYQLLKISVKLLPTSIICLATIPLISAEKFQFLKIFPLPTMSHGQLVFLQPSTEYILFNKLTEHYSPLKNDELQRCILVKEGQYICDQNHPLYNIKSNRSLCEVNFLTHNENVHEACRLVRTDRSRLWIRMHAPNKWIYVMDEPTTIETFCQNEHDSFSLSGEGILTITSLCILKDRHVTLWPQGNLYSNMSRASFLPYLNLTQELTKPEQQQIHHIPMEHLDVNLNSVITSIQQIKEQQHLPTKISATDVHQFAAIYVLGGLVAVIIVLWLWKQISCCQPKLSSQV